MTVLATRLAMGLALVAPVVLASTLGGCGDSGDTGDTGSSTSSETGDETGSDTGDTGDTGSTGSDTSDTDDTGATGGDTGDTAATGDTVPPAGPPPCVDDEGCTGEGAICDCTGTCVVPDTNPCTGIFNCNPGDWCNPCTGHCEVTLGLCDACAAVSVCDSEGACSTAPGGPCAEQGMCLEFASGGSHCGLECISDAGCPTGFTCIDVADDRRQCVPLSGQCSDLGVCESDAECPDGEICSDALSTCAPGCTEDGQCAGELVCVQARCVEACTTDDDCEGEAVCEANGHCKIPGSCENSAECEPAHYCHKDLGECVAGCLQDAHCQDDALVCENQLCEPKGCLHNYQCAFEQECDKPDAACLPMAKDHCATCDASAEDAAAQCGGDPNLCVTFQDEEGNEIGDYCLLTCEDDPIDKCPQGYGCEKIEAPDAGIDGFYCIRSCWVDPVAP